MFLSAIDHQEEKLTITNGPRNVFAFYKISWIA